MNKKYTLLFLALFSSTCSLATVLENTQGNQRDLHIALDLLGQEVFMPHYAASAMQLSNGLMAESAPILTTLYCWKTLTKNSKDMRSHDQKAWESYYHTKGFLLFIPKAYKTKLEASTAQDLGFNLEDWQEVTDIHTLYTPSFLQTCKDYLAFSINNDILHRNALLPLYSSQFIGVIKKLLLNKKAKDFKWNILLCGHGGTSPISVAIVGGLYPTYFKRFLSVLNNQVSTRVLVYLTCNGGSNNFLNTLYTTKGIRNTYNFTLVCPCLTAISSFTTQQPEFNKFFTLLHEAPIEQSSSAKLMQALRYCVPLGEFSVTVEDKIVTKTLFNNMPHICWAHTDHFEIGRIEGHIEPISYLMDKNSEQKAVNSKSFGDKQLRIDAQTLIIDQPYIPYTLVLPQGKKHFIASSLENQISYIHGLKIENLTCEGDLLTLCKKSLKKRSHAHVLLIENVEYTLENKTHILNSVIIFLHALTPETYRYQRVNKLFYVKDNTAYTVNLKRGNQTLKKLTPAIAKKYFMFFEQEKALIQAQAKTLAL